MATIQSIIDRVTDITRDTNHVRWTIPELSRWINDAQDQIATLHPRSASQYVTLTLQAGARQDLRTIDAAKRWIRLFELTCNVSNDTPTGRSIRQVSRPALDFSTRTWRGKAPTALEVKEFAMDEREVYTFDVNPPVQAGVKVLALVSVKPEPVAELDGNGELVNPDEEFGLADGYDIPAVDYVLFRCFNKDANDPAYAARAAQHLQVFNLAMGVETRDAGAA